MTRLDPAAAAFLLPGLLHRFGNALFAVDGRARLLLATIDPTQPLRETGGAVPTGSQGPDASSGAAVHEDLVAIAESAGGAMRALSVLRWMVGEDEAETAPLGVVVEDLLEVARAPLGDFGVVARADLEPDLATCPVGTAATLAGLAEAVHHLVRAGRSTLRRLRLTGRRVPGTGIELQVHALAGADENSAGLPIVVHPGSSVLRPSLTPLASGLALAIHLHDQP